MLAMILSPKINPLPQVRYGIEIKGEVVYGLKQFYVWVVWF